MKQGSALILTILLITAVSTILFSVARLTYSDIAQVGRLEESIVAQEAAESGLEMGLLTFRLNHEAETTFNATATLGDALNFDLTSNQIVSSVTQSSYSNPLASTKMWWKEDRLGALLEGSFNVDTTQSPKLFKDQSQELDLSNLVGGELRFYWTGMPDHLPLPQCGSADCDSSTQFLGLEFVLNAVDSTGQVLECNKRMPVETDWPVAINNSSPVPERYSSLSWNCPRCIQYNVDDPTRCDQYTWSTYSKYKLRIKPYIRTTDDNLKPYIYYAAIGNETNPALPIDNGTTHIYSTGFYGSTKRTLIIDLDRSSTRLLGLYDLIIGGLTGEVTGPGQ